MARTLHHNSGGRTREAAEDKRASAAAINTAKHALTRRSRASGRRRGSSNGEMAAHTQSVLPRARRAAPPLPSARSIIPCTHAQWAKK